LSGANPNPSSQADARIAPTQAERKPKTLSYHDKKFLFPLIKNKRCYKVISFTEKLTGEF